MYLTIGWGDLSHKKVYSYNKKMFILRAKPIRIISVQISGVLLYLGYCTGTWQPAPKFVL